MIICGLFYIYTVNKLIISLAMEYALLYAINLHNHVSNTYIYVIILILIIISVVFLVLVNLRLTIIFFKSLYSLNKRIFWLFMGLRLLLICLSIWNSFSIKELIILNVHQGIVVPDPNNQNTNGYTPITGNPPTGGAQPLARNIANAIQADPKGLSDGMLRNYRVFILDVLNDQHRAHYDRIAGAHVAQVAQGQAHPNSVDWELGGKANLVNLLRNSN